MRNFQPGLYRCGKELLSSNAGQTCQTYLDCPTNYGGIYAYCGCTYSSTSQQCDILYSNHEYQDYIQAVSVLTSWFRLSLSKQRLHHATMPGSSKAAHATS